MDIEPHVYSCPHCQQIMTIPAISFWNSRGKKRTDGKGTGRLYCGFSLFEENIISCPSCSRLSWLSQWQLEDEKKYDNCPLYESGGTFPDREAELACLKELIAQDFARSKEELLLLRYALWLLLNDLGLQSRESTLFEENITKLIKLLDNPTDEALLIKAEACRELGHFDEAQTILQKVSGDYEFEREYLSDLCRRRDSMVAYFPVPDSPGPEFKPTVKSDIDDPGGLADL